MNARLACRLRRSALVCVVLAGPDETARGILSHEGGWRLVESREIEGQSIRNRASNIRTDWRDELEVALCVEPKNGSSTINTRGRGGERLWESGDFGGRLEAVTSLIVDLRSIRNGRYKADGSPLIGR